MKLEKALNRFMCILSFIEQLIDYWKSEKPLRDKRFCKHMKTNCYSPFDDIVCYLNNCRKALIEMCDYLEKVLDCEELIVMTLEKQNALIEEEDPLVLTILMEQPILGLRILRLEEFGKEAKIICSLPTKSRIEKHVRLLKWKEV